MRVIKVQGGKEGISEDKSTPRAPAVDGKPSEGKCYRGKEGTCNAPWGPHWRRPHLKEKRRFFRRRASVTNCISRIKKRGDRGAEDSNNGVARGLGTQDKEMGKGGGGID